MVWGFTPSSAATTNITISVTCAPRARNAVKASCPGVSKNVKVFFLTSTVVPGFQGRGHARIAPGESG